MIRLKKIAEPESLRKYGVKWTEELLQLVKEAKKPSPTLLRAYDQDDIKEALRSECYSKCMYCESRVAHVAYEHIEHIKPKSRFPEEAYLWKNLGLACPKCNVSKKDHYDNESPWLNPYEDNPEEHLVAAGHFIYHHAGSLRGENTEHGLGLNRLDLLEQRKERIDSLRNLADRIKSLPDGAAKKALEQQLEEELKPERPYAFCANAIIRAVLKR